MWVLRCFTGSEQEHVIARNLFPKPRPAMITIPACGKCNDEKKAYDDDLRDMLTIDIENERHPVTGAELKGNLIRAIKRNQSVYVRSARGKSRRENIVSPGGVILGNANRAYVDPVKVNKTFDWIVRGLYFKIKGKTLPPDCTFEAGKVFFTAREAAIKQYLELGAIKGPSIGTTFESWHRIADEIDPPVSFWLLRFFNVLVWVHCNFDKHGPKKDSAPLRSFLGPN